MNTIEIVIFFLLNLITILAFAHGEDRPGPHGGYIRMPGAFHTELLMLDEKRLAIYLLDIAIKAPVTKDSSVEVFYEHNEQNTKLNCTPAGNRFECESAKIFVDTGHVKVIAERQSIKGGTAKYQLPLTYSKDKKAYKDGIR